MAYGTFFLLFYRIFHIQLNIFYDECRHGEREKNQIDRETFLTFARFAMNPNCNAMKQLQIGVQHYNFFMLHRARKK